MGRALEDEGGFTELMRAAQAGYGMSAASSPDDAKLAKWFYLHPVRDEGMSVNGYHVEWDRSGGEGTAEPTPVPCDCEDSAGSREGPAFEKVKRDAIKKGVHVPGGRAIYRDAVYIHIQKPGDRDMIIDTEAWISSNPGDTMAHNNRFPKEWQSFLDKKGEAVIGTPLSELCSGSAPILRPSQAEEFRFVGVRTAEQLLAMDDQSAQKFPGFSITKKKVQTYMDAAAKNAPVQMLRSELGKRDERIAYLESIVHELQSIAQAEETQAKKSKKSKAA